MTGAIPATYTVFSGERRLAEGSADTAAAAARLALSTGADRVLVFDDVAGRQIDVDLRSPRPRLAIVDPSAAERVERPGPGRPKLGVVPREVTLLPRHWEWLGRQPGGASAALRRLVEAASRDMSGADAQREAQTAAYNVMNALAGHLTGYEDALRALYANDAGTFDKLVGEWPEDVSQYVRRLGERAFLAQTSGNR